MKNLIKDRIEALMNEKNLSQAEFARKLGIGNNATISRILSGHTRPSYDVLERIIKNFPEINTVWLMKGTGEIFAKEQEKSNSTELEEVRIELREMQKLNNELVRQMMEINKRFLVTGNPETKKKESNTDV